MTFDWTPVIVAVISGLLLLPPAILGLLGGRVEPRRLRELKALNEILRDLPDSDEGYAALRTYRTNVMVAYSERSSRVDPTVVVMVPLVIGWLLCSIGLFIVTSRGKPINEVIDASAVWVANTSIAVGLISLGVGAVIALVVLAAVTTRGWRRLAHRVRRRHPDRGNH